MDETEYLLSSATNREHLERSLRAFRPATNSAYAGVTFTDDDDAQASYLYLSSLVEEDVEQTLEFGTINIDVNRDGEIIGIEFLDRYEPLAQIIAAGMQAARSSSLK